MYHQCPALFHHLMSHHQCPALPHLSTTRNLGIHPPTLVLCRPMILADGERHHPLPLVKVQEFTSHLIHLGRHLPPLQPPALKSVGSPVHPGEHHMEDTLVGRLIPPLQPLALKSVGHPVHPGEHRMEDTLAGRLTRIFVRAIYLCPE